MTGLEIAAWLAAASYVATFAAMSASLVRRAAVPVWLFGRGSERQAWPALLFRIAFAGAVIWPLGRALISEPAVGAGWLAVAGLLLILAGAALALLSQRHMGFSWRIGAAHGEVGAIVEDGPFAYSRNPVFVGQVALFVGLLLAFPGPVQAALTLTLLIAVLLQVRIEERVLGASLGERYRAYQRRVPRWLGMHGDAR